LQGVRERAAATLVDKVVADQKAFKQRQGEEDAAPGSAESTSHQAKQLSKVLVDSSPLVIYTIRRLCQGLASSRKGARQGFATALSNLLEHANWIQPAQPVAVVTTLLSPPGSAKKSEVKDALIGQLFALGSIVRAYKRLDGDVAISIALKLVQIADKRSFLRQAACTSFGCTPIMAAACHMS
jgi:DNA polymerase phi